MPQATEKNYTGKVMLTMMPVLKLSNIKMI